MALKDERISWKVALAHLPPARRRVYRGVGTAHPRDVVGCGMMEPLAGEVHFHRNVRQKDYSFCYVLRGRGRFVDEDGTEFPLRPGSVFQRIPGRPHSSFAETDSGYLEFFLFLPGHFFHALARLGVVPADCAVWDIGLRPAVLRQFCHVFEQLAGVTDATAGLVLADITRLLADAALLRRVPATGDAAGRRRLDEACQSLGNAFGGELDLRQLAAEAGMGYETFRKFFRRHMGASPKAYGLGRRIEQAKALLADPTMRMKNVASLLGYYDTSAFSRQFKQATGVPPSAYRRKKGGGG